MTYNEALDSLDIVGHKWRQHNRSRDQLKEHFQNTKKQAKLVSNGGISYMDACHNVRCYQATCS